MKLFKRATLDWWQFGILKVSLLAIGIAIGAAWPDVFAQYITALVVIGIVTGLYMTYVWFKVD